MSERSRGRTKQEYKVVERGKRREEKKEKKIKKKRKKKMIFFFFQAEDGIRDISV